jgi:hypothetical protein
MEWHLGTDTQTDCYLQPAPAAEDVWPGSVFEAVVAGIGNSLLPIPNLHC